MATRIIKAALGITVLLVVLIVYFFQINDHKMAMLCAKLLVASFLIFWFASALFRKAEKPKHRRPKWKKAIGVGGFLLPVYPIYLAVNYIVAYSTKLDESAMTDATIGGLTFFQWVSLAGGIIAILAALGYGLTKIGGVRKIRRRATW